MLIEKRLNRKQMCFSPALLLFLLHFSSNGVFIDLLHNPKRSKSTCVLDFSFYDSKDTSSNKMNLTLKDQDAFFYLKSPFYTQFQKIIFHPRLTCKATFTQLIIKKPPQISRKQHI